MNTEEKAKICGIYVDSQNLERFIIKEFGNILSQYQINSDYINVLFEFGCFQYLEHNTYDNKLAEYKEQDETLLFSIEAFKLLRALLVSEGGDFTFSPSNTQEPNIKIKKESPLNSFIFTATLESLKAKMEDWGNLSISKTNAEHMLKSGFCSEWSEKWMIKHKANFPNANYSETKTLITKDFLKYLNSMDLTIEYIDFMLDYTEKERIWLLGEKNRLGRDYSPQNKQLGTSGTIRLLSFFLTFDEYIKSESADIRDITLSDNFCSFIYDYLLFFEIYFFQSADTNTTTKAKSIRSKIVSFDKRKDISPMHIALDILYTRIRDMKQIIIRNSKQ